jgi:hypothetical protein
MYVTDRPVMDRLTDPLISAINEAQTLAGELDMALYDPEPSERGAAQVHDDLWSTLDHIESLTTS